MHPQQVRAGHCANEARRPLVQALAASNRMKIGSNDEFIELKELERNPESAPCAGDINLQVNLKLQDFYGSCSGVWLETPAMEEFLRELESLEISRKGEAKIASMSPEEFILKIHSSDTLGHMEIETQLHRNQYSGSKYWPIYLKGGFEVQSDTIKQLVLCFKEFTS